MKEKKQILDQKRIRKINGSFSWIDHRFITDGFLDELSAESILLYFFLVAVSDRNGISFYHDDRICHMLKINLHSLGEARRDLIERSLIVYKYPLYQVLALPNKPEFPPTEEEKLEIKRTRDLSYAQNLLEKGATLFEVKEMLGHESIESTQKYLSIHTTLMREVLLLND